MLGKITKAEFGFGGYQDAQFGFSIVIESKNSGVSDFSGFWADEASEHAKWDELDQNNYWSEMLRELRDILELAQVRHVSDLVGKPVEVVFERNKLVSWRILDEVI